MDLEHVAFLLDMLIGRTIDGNITNTTDFILAYRLRFSQVEGLMNEIGRIVAELEAGAEVTSAEMLYRLGPFHTTPGGPTEIFVRDAIRVWAPQLADQFRD